MVVHWLVDSPIVLIGHPIEVTVDHVVDIIRFDLPMVRNQPIEVTADRFVFIVSPILYVIVDRRILWPLFWAELSTKVGQNV
jgi:hypothetical protein